MIKLPEPYDQILRFEGSIGLRPGPAVFVQVYTADQLKQAIRDALEEAAKVCESIARDDYGMTYLHGYGECAAAIRKLKEDIQ